jgi:hypothetical protein
MTDSKREFGFGLLGPLHCWAVVFANAGSSIYYVPGVFYGVIFHKYLALTQAQPSLTLIRVPNISS